MIIIDKNRCDLCGTCVAVCPENVMTMNQNELQIDHDGCTRCSNCVWICPVEALELNLKKKIPSTETA